MDSKEMMGLTKVIGAMKEHRPSNRPDEHLHTVAMVCRVIAGGMSPVSESGRLAIHSAADLLDYIASVEGPNTVDSPVMEAITRMGKPHQPETSVIDRLNRAALPRPAALALQTIAIAADYIDYSEVTMPVDLMGYINGGGEPQ